LIDPTRAIKGRLNDYSAAIHVLAQKKRILAGKNSWQRIGRQHGVKSINDY
jgi:hypothetical protein